MKKVGVSDDTIWYLHFCTWWLWILVLSIHLDQQARAKEIRYVCIGFYKKIITSDLSQRLNNTTQ